MPTKTCTKCETKKPLSEFGKDLSTRDGLFSSCKACRKAANAAWHAANKERRKATNAAWRAANQGKRRAANAAWRAANTERAKATKAAWRAANTERAKATKAAWVAANRERVKANAVSYRARHPECGKKAEAKWRKANPGKGLIYAQNRRARKRATADRLSPGLSEKLFTLQQGKCACCNKRLGKSFHLDHIVPLAKGGSNADANIQLLRAICNQQKGSKDPLRFMRSRGLLL